MACLERQVPVSRTLVPTGPREDPCPVAETAKILGKKWFLIILHELSPASRGFNDLKRAVDGISAKVLSESLDELERKGLVTRRVTSESPRRVVYSLTEKGGELGDLFYAMERWGKKWTVCAD